MTRPFVARSLLLAALVFTTTEARADLLTFDFTGVGTPGTESANPAGGNQWTFTVGGVTLNVTAWSLLEPAPGAFAASTAVMPGVGVCNTVENCRTTEHSVDNLGQGDFLLFQFDQDVLFEGVGLQPRRWSSDTDASYFISEGAAPGLNLSGLTTSTLGNGFGSQVNSDTSAIGAARTVAPGGTWSNALLFGARLGDASQDDLFKVTSLTAHSVPEPGTLSLLGMSAGAAFLVRRRRR